MGTPRPCFLMDVCSSPRGREQVAEPLWRLPSSTARSHEPGPPLVPCYRLVLATPRPCWLMERCSSREALSGILIWRPPPSSTTRLPEGGLPPVLCTRFVIPT